MELNGKRAHYTGDDYPEGLVSGDRVIVFATSSTRVAGVIAPPGYWLFAGGYGVFRRSAEGMFERTLPWFDSAGDRLGVEDVRYLLENPDTVDTTLVDSP